MGQRGLDMTEIDQDRDVTLHGWSQKIRLDKEGRGSGSCEGEADHT